MCAHTQGWLIKDNKEKHSENKSVFPQVTAEIQQWAGDRGSNLLKGCLTPNLPHTRAICLWLKGVFSLLYRRVCVSVQLVLFCWSLIWSWSHGLIASVQLGKGLAKEGLVKKAGLRQALKAHKLLLCQDCCEERQAGQHCLVQSFLPLTEQP